MSVIGREVATVFGNDAPERSWWIGKPWRRLEVVRREMWYRGVMVDRSWDVSLHIGNRRLGVGATVAVVRQAGLDYTDEPHQ